MLRAICGSTSDHSGWLSQFAFVRLYLAIHKKSLFVIICTIDETDTRERM